MRVEWREWSGLAWGGVGWGVDHGDVHDAKELEHGLALFAVQQSVHILIRQIELYAKVGRASVL